MTRIRALAVLTVAVSMGAAALGVPASADETGLAASHSWRKEGGKVCFSDHWHYGTGSGPTRKAAERDAAGAWAGFTSFEYGSTWARYSKAASKKMSCSQGSGGWNCSVEARPCR